jgi:membrane-associated phospholipid phosphatase
MLTDFQPKILTSHNGLLWIRIHTNTKKIGLYFLLFLFTVNCLAQNADINLLKEINLNRNSSLDPSFRFITNTASPISISTPLIFFTVGLIHKDSALKRKGINIGGTVLIASILSTALKYSINRDRPFVTYPFIEKATLADSPSFPSGHTSTAFATATSLSMAFPKWYVIAPSYLWAGTVGYSRMQLGVHYPSDVLAGAILGSGSAFLTCTLNKWINKKKKRSAL